MTKILIIGASGFVGRALARAALAEGLSVRCLARDPAKVEDLKAAGCETVRGDVSDRGSLEQAFGSAGAAYVAIHTLSPQPEAGPDREFMEVEAEGIRNIIAAARANGVRRLIYVTSVGIAAEAASSWLRGRWRTEQMLLNSGLDATMFGPGQIVGRGGRGFEAILANARRRVAVLIGDGRLRMRTIALDDLVHYLLDAREVPATFNRHFDVGSDDVLTIREMVDVAAQVLGRDPPMKLSLPLSLLTAIGPVAERLARMPKGAVQGLVDSLRTDGIGDPVPIRTILPRPLLSYRDAVLRAVAPS